MKITVDISNTVLHEARVLAAENGISVSDLLESGLRQTVVELRSRKSFKLRDCGFRGNGLTERATWERIRDEAYGNRSG